MKTSFYFRTRDEYTKVSDYVTDINKEHDSAKRLDLLSVYSRYAPVNGSMNPMWLGIPKSVVGDKKYIGTVAGNKHKLLKAGIHPERFLQHLDMELASKEKARPKPKGEQTVYPTNLRTYDEFRKITSVFNKRFGCGNWRIQSPKGLQNMLRKMSDKDDSRMYIFEDDGAKLREKYPDGVPVNFIANEPNADFKKLLFKVALKG